MLKPTKNGELIDIWPSFQIANNKGADQTARMRRLVCAFVVRKQLGFSVEVHMMLKPRLPDIRLATRLL